jgi:sec-independent protein translocase protein TatC
MPASVPPPSAADPDLPLIGHLLALRRALVRSLLGVALLVVPGFLAAPYAIRRLVAWCLPPEIGPLHYFAPMEVFVSELEFGLVLALAAGFPWCAAQAWGFLLPALRPSERRFLGRGVLFSSALFLAGAAFCVGVILPLLMRFSAGFASDAVTPVLGLRPFLRLAGGITLAFGLMFQAPAAVVLAVRAGVVSVGRVRHARPYVWTAILVLSALLTPPDIASQCLLAVPTGLLFELGLLLAAQAGRTTFGHIPQAEGD